MTIDQLSIGNTLLTYLPCITKTIITIVTKVMKRLLRNTLKNINNGLSHEPLETGGDEGQLLSLVNMMLIPVKKLLTL